MFIKCIKVLGMFWILTIRFIDGNDKLQKYILQLQTWNCNNVNMSVSAMYKKIPTFVFDWIEIQEIIIFTIS